MRGEKYSEGVIGVGYEKSENKHEDRLVEAV